MIFQDYTRHRRQSDFNTEMEKDGGTMQKSTNYRIKVQGRLDEKWSDRLGGMRITVDRSSGQSPVTKLEGRLRDQAALAGVLNTLYELHLPVLSVVCLE